MGDFNMDIRIEKNLKKLKETTKDMNIISKLNYFTRSDSSSNPSTIDFFIYNKHEGYLFDILEPIGNSDH